MDPTAFTADVAVLLERELEGFQREIRLFPDDETLWATRPGVANSAGNLALHVAGNLRHFVGSILGDIPYKRDREAEFARRTGTREDVVAELANAAAVVREVLPRVPPSRLDDRFEGASTPRAVTTRRFLMHLCTHAAFHVGQAGYLRRILTGDTTSSDSVTAERIA
jgi:uncharacterized damage-inducible protein DinB